MLRWLKERWDEQGDFRLSRPYTGEREPSTVYGTLGLIALCFAAYYFTNCF